MLRMFIICYPPAMSKVGKRERLKNLGMRIPVSLHKRLVQAAVADRRSLSDEVLVLIELGLKHRR